MRLKKATFCETITEKHLVQVVADRQIALANM